MHGPMKMPKYVKAMEGYDTANLEEKEKLHKKAYNRMLGYIYIRGAKHNTSGALDRDLNNTYTLGEDRYPVDLNAAMNMMPAELQGPKRPQYLGKSVRQWPKQ